MDAQQESPLPDAPAAAITSSVSSEGGISAVAEETGRQEGAALPVQAQTETAVRELGTPATPWLLARSKSEDSKVAEDWEGSNATEGVRIDVDALVARMDRLNAMYGSAGAGGQVAGPMAERYHVKGLLWESFAFFGVENAQRLMADPYFRSLTADKPFWHDYIASVKNWNWRRWDDGDDFLVAYIAHPLQGSVTEFIERQNSPSRRAVRIDDGAKYWKAMVPSFLWATAFSFDQKLGPLGETALGSEGGYTYVIGCNYPCPSYNPSTMKVTNNTGWVKLVTTPVVGTLWTVMEDALDHFVSDRVQGDDYTRVFPKILRGSLNPAHTMANALRWRKPWYRDYQYDAADVHFTPRPHFLPGDDQVILNQPKYDVFPHFVEISLPVNTSSCTYCKQPISGYGFGFAGRIATYADLDSDVNYLPNASPVASDRSGGSALNATFGLRSGYTNKYFSLKAFLRPGILSWDKAYTSSPSATNPTPAIGRITHFTTALGIDGDININRHLALRAVIGNSPVRYREPNRDPPGLGTYPYLYWISKLYFLTNENWTYQTGAVMRF